ncbi:PorP/SprF family type IX secretion system membrane protein [Algibacter mikhailovii]|uniref:PorP/SprF family type IX secretion system membrane protein n=1 Tax=Algibacter mikhailovii TaxID=425498 RepID=UPI002495062D|nr:PorP/SprF family type IX secretion system membrane protein [Algibacter mikhailovii]
MKIKILHIVLILGLSLQVFSQDEGGVVSYNIPIRNSLKFNRHIINPAFSLVREQNKYISFTNKRENTQFDNAPQTYLFGYAGRFEENIGGGLSLFQQNYGVLTTFGGVANFAYNVGLSRESNLTFGMNLGVYNSGLNQGKVVTNFSDPALDNIPSNLIVTINPGINYGMGFFDFGLSINNLVAFNITNSNMIEDNPEQGIQVHAMYTGYFDSRGFFDESKFSGLIRSEFKQEQTVISGLMMVTVPKGIWAQVGYNTLYGMSVGAGLNISSQIAIEYNYEKSLGDLSVLGNSHEITLAYKFKNNTRYYYNGDDDEQALIVQEKRRSRVSRSRTSSKPDPRKSGANAQKQQATIAAAALLVEEKEAEEKAKQDADNSKAEQDAIALEEANRLKAEQEAQALAETNRLEAEKAAKLKAEQDAIALAEANRLKAEQEAQALAEANRLEAEKAAKLIAEKDAIVLAEANRLKAEQEAQALAETNRLEAEKAAKLKAEQDAIALAEANRLKAEQEAQALAEANRLEAEKAAKLKAEQDAIALAEANRLKAEQEAQALVEANRLEAEKAAKLKAEQEAIALTEANRLKAEQEAQALVENEEIEAPVVPTDEATVLMNEITRGAIESNKAQQELLSKLTEKVNDKQKDLDDLIEENDLSEQGIVKAPKPFKSVSAENRELEELTEEIDKVIQSQNDNIRRLDNIYKERLAEVPNEEDRTNRYYKQKIKDLKSEQVKAIRLRQSSLMQIKQLKEDIKVEKKRRIKRALYDNEDDRYEKDRSTLERIRNNTPLSTKVLEPKDFDYGEKLSNIQILKDVKKIEKGYYLVVAVHTDLNKRDEFLTKAVAAGESNINFFYDVNTSKYYIYSEKHASINQAQNAMKSKGTKPFNGNMSMVKIEN